MDDEEDIRSADDALETADDAALSVGKERLEEDNDSPAAPPDDQEDSLPRDYPLTDSGLDTHEVYDEGKEAASGYDDNFVGPVNDEMAEGFEEDLGPTS